MAWSESFQGSPKSSLHETVKMKTELQWRPHNPGDRRIMGFLLRKTSREIESAQEGETLCIVGNTSGGEGVTEIL